MIRKIGELIGFTAKTDYAQQQGNEKRLPHTENYIKQVGGKYTTPLAFVILSAGIVILKSAEIFLKPIPKADPRKGPHGGIKTQGQRRKA